MHATGNKQRRIFVVDDEEIIAVTLAMILQKSGFDATSFTHPVKALEAIRAEAPDLLISDVMMPEINGIELATQVQRECPNCRVLLFSGQANTQGLLDTARTSGDHFEFISKPVHPSDLLKKIERGLGLAQAR
jgi:DNA-binding NtrC family response regulator